MNIEDARTILSKWLHRDDHGSMSMPDVVVRLTSNGLLYETPDQFSGEEVEALAVWVLEATKPPSGGAA